MPRSWECRQLERIQPLLSPYAHCRVLFLWQLRFWPKTKEWLANHGISKDTYYYWYKKVQTVCVEAMEMPDTLSMPEFMSLPVPAEPANVPVESAIRSYVVVTIHIGKAGIEAEWDKLLD